MIEFLLSDGTRGVVLSKKDVCHDIKKIANILDLDLSYAYCSIPHAADELLQLLPSNFQKSYFDKPCYKLQFERFATQCSQPIILFDDILCTGGTLLNLVDGLDPCILSKVFAVIPYYIPTRNLLFYDTKEKEYTIMPKESIYNIFFINKRKFLPIRVFIYHTYRSVLLKKDVFDFGKKYKYFLDSDPISYDQVLSLIDN